MSTSRALQEFYGLTLALQKSKSNSNTVLDFMSEAYFLMDRDGFCIRGNKSAAYMLVCRKEKIYLESIVKLFSEGNWLTFQSKMDQVISETEAATDPDVVTTIKFQLLADGGLFDQNYEWTMFLLQGLSKEKQIFFNVIAKEI